jgi:hypothetical protein
MVNLGGSNDDDKNEEEDMQNSKTNNVSAQSKDAMGNKYNSNEEDDGAKNIIANKEGAVCREVMEKKKVSKKHLQ